MAEASTQANGGVANAPATPPEAPPAAPAAPPAAAPGGGEDPNWRFIPSQPMREDQVQNAVNFLSHPKVKNSPVVYRRSFLERKGLSREEIDEAFRRVPDPPSSSTPTAATAVAVPAAPAAAPAAAAVPMAGTVAVAPRRAVPWSQVALAIGLLSAAGAGAAVVTKNYLYPRFKAWLRRIVLDDDTDLELEPKKLSSEADRAAAALTTATAEIAALARELVSSRHEERRHFDTLVKSIEAQSRDIKLSLDTLVQLQRRASSTPSVGETNGYKAQVPRDAKGPPLTYEQRPSSAPYSLDADKFTPSAKYSEILAMVERGEKPPGIRDVNDKPPNPTQPASNSTLQPKAKPWEGYASPANGASPEPWWRQKDTDAKRPADNGVQIVEIEDQDVVSSDGGVFTASAQTEATSRSWVPPPVPKTILPGVDAAIRHPSPTPQAAYDSTYSRIATISADSAGASSSTEISDDVEEASSSSQGRGNVEVVSSSKGVVEASSSSQSKGVVEAWSSSQSMENASEVRVVEAQ